LTQHETPQADRRTGHLWRGLLRVTALAAAAGVTVLALVGGAVSARADVPAGAVPAAASTPHAPAASAHP
jgi:hypothetical protein